MKRKTVTYFILMAASLMLYGCRDEYAGELESYEIHLGGQVASSVQSRTDVEIGVDYDSQQPLDISLVRWDENGDANSNSIIGRTPLNATLGVPDATDAWKREVTFSPSQFYRNREDNVGFVGWHPRTEGWVTTEEGGESIIDSNRRMTYNIDGKTDVMVSDFQKGNFGTGIPALTFRHALCMYKIYAYYVDEVAKAKWGNLSQVTFQNLPEQLFVTWPEDITSGQAEFSYSPAPEDGATYKEVTLFDKQNENNELPVGTTDSETTYQGTVLGGAPAIGALGISIKTTELTENKSISIARKFTPGYTYNIYLKLSVKGVIDASVSVGSWKYTPDNEITIDEDMSLLNDLSRYGTANCYVVSSGNSGYCFDATVKGNGVNKLTRRDGTVIQLPDLDVDIADEIEYVKVFRSDAMVEVHEDGTMTLIPTDERPTTEMITLLSDKLSDGKVKFWVKGFTDENGKPIPDDYKLKYKGNAKIAAYNAQNEIVWSWHIWITDRPQNQGYQNGTVAMDRNLGAVTATPLSPGDGYVDAMTIWAGLFYQWGRKDAIFRRTVDPGYVADDFPLSIKTSPVSVAEAHKDPSTYYYDINGNNWTTDTDNNDHFWGYVSDREDYIKTLYDPCPPGYRVSGNAMWSSQAEEVSLGTIGKQNAGYYYNIGNYIKVYYPSTACVYDGKIYHDDMVGSSGETPNNYVFQLSATPGADGTAYHFRYEQDDFQTSGGTFETIVSDNSKYRTKRSAAYPVRCVFEESGPVVTNLSALQTANSYIIRKSGYYKFKANVRGNGVTNLQVIFKEDGTEVTRLVHFDAGLGQNISASEMGKADVLWWQGDLTQNPKSNYLTFVDSEDSNNSVNIEQKCPIQILDNGQVYDNEIMFYANVREGGNVGIALYDNNGTILWTWHIWIVPEGVKGKQFGDYIMMDRNLGATYAPANAREVNSGNVLSTYGMYYQWGRKDPLFGPKAYNGTGRSTWFWKNNGVWQKKTDMEIAREKNIQYSVQHPLCYMNRDDQYWWQTTYNPGPDLQVRNLWGYTGSSTTAGDSYAKTMWDPCPPGYRLMNHSVFATLNGMDENKGYEYTLTDNNSSGGITNLGVCFNPGLQTTTYDIYDLKENLDEYIFSTNNESGEFISADNVWFPHSGWTNKEQKWSDVGSAGFIFSASPNKEGKFARSFTWRFVNGAYKVKHDMKGWEQQSKPVRCVME